MTGVTGLQHIGIPTRDLETTVRFYESLGFAVAYRTINERSGEAVAFLRLKNVTVETWETRQAVGAYGAIDHLALDVTDVDAAFAEAKAMGLKLLHSEVQFLPFWDKGVRFFTIEGPNCEKIEFSQML